ncbi:MAG: universal stress protein [Bacteriovoracaceae bacterium]
MQFKNITLAVVPENFCFEGYKKFFADKNLENVTVNLVHIFEIRNFINEFSAYTYPDEEMMPKIKGQFLEMLERFGQELFGDCKAVEVKAHCLFNTDIKKGMVDFLDENKSELVLVPTEGKHGLSGIFHSSFAQHLCQFSHCPVLVLK